MVLAAPPIRKLHVGGRSRRHAGFRRWKSPVSAEMHRGCNRVTYDFAPGRSNHLYSVAATTNTSGSVVERYSYNAYGVRTVKNSAGATLAGSAMSQDRAFTGYKSDNESALMYARNRVYFGKLGRFVSRDPISYNDGWGLYAAYFVPGKLDWQGLGVNPPPTNVLPPDMPPSFGCDDGTPMGQSREREETKSCAYECYKLADWTCPCTPTGYNSTQETGVRKRKITETCIWMPVPSLGTSPRPPFVNVNLWGRFDFIELSKTPWGSCEGGCKPCYIRRRGPFEN